MRMSQLAEVPQTRSIVDYFYGYNHNLTISEGEMYDMRNLSSDSYPALSVRKKRGKIGLPDVTGKVNGMISKEELCIVKGKHLFVGDKEVEGLELEDSKKQLVSMGAYIIIFPDKAYCNTKDLDDCGFIERHYLSEGNVNFSICRVDGTEYENVIVSADSPAEPENSQYWIDTSTTPHTLKQYVSTTSMWTSIASTYVRISAKNIAKDLKQYDAVTLKGIESSQLSDLDNKTSVLWEVHRDEDGDGEKDYIVVIGIIDKVYSQSAPLTVERNIPIMDFVVESGNRLWGCRYGTNINGDTVNEIYASKLGDFRNWNCYMGIASDSYAASCGTDGQFTGAFSYLGYPIFFKENCIHKVYGNFPSNYQVQSTACRGVMLGAGDSIAIANETLFYKSRNGVCVYDGSLPKEISSAFGDIHYTDVDGEDVLRNGAVAGSNGNKYYISMLSEEDKAWHLFAYDVAKGFWHKEDNTRVSMFCSHNGEMYFCDNARGEIRSVSDSSEENTEQIEWMAETGVLGASIRSGRGKTPLPGKKYISQVLVRMSLKVGSYAMFYVQYDSEGEWEHITTITGNNLKSYTAQIRPKRCDHFRIRIIGKGDATIYSVTKNIEQGSDMR